MPPSYIPDAADAAEPGARREAHLSAPQQATEADAWLPQADAVEGRTPRPLGPPPQGPEAADRHGRVEVDRSNWRRALRHPTFDSGAVSSSPPPLRPASLPKRERIRKR